MARLCASGADLCQVDRVWWIEDVERRLGFSYPRSFRALVTRYLFRSLEVGSVEIFANLGDGSNEDVTVAPFRDRYMSPWLIAHKLLQFGRPASGSYDPVCFDFGEEIAEPSVVRLDHEDILQERSEVHRQVLAPNFLALLQVANDP